MEQRPSDSDPHALLLVIPLVLAVLCAGLWHYYQTSLYLTAAQWCYTMLWPWQWLEPIAQYRRGIPTTVMLAPSAWQTFVWFQYAFALPAWLCAGAAVWLGVKGLRHPIVSRFRGALSPDALMRHQAMVFSAIAPLIPVARSLHNTRDPRWHESYHPHEWIALHKLALADGKLDEAATEKALLAQLGARLCHHGKDKAGIVFTDRLNNYEKTVFALLAPLALKRKDGVPEYTQLRDALNYSVDPKTQVPQLSLAQASYARYRADPRVQSLAMRHPYATTFLMELFALSKQSGRVTTVEFLGWLRPNHSGLYFALNTVGRRTPFAESTGAYAQWLFEKSCVKAQRLPVLPCVQVGVMAMVHEWQQYCDSKDDTDDASLWGSLSANAIEADSDLYQRLLAAHTQPIDTPSPQQADAMAAQASMESDLGLVQPPVDPISIEQAPTLGASRRSQDALQAAKQHQADPLSGHPELYQSLFPGKRKA